MEELIDSFPRIFAAQGRHPHSGTMLASFKRPSSHRTFLRTRRYRTGKSKAPSLRILDVESRANRCDRVITPRPARSNFTFRLSIRSVPKLRSHNPHLGPNAPTTTGVSNPFTRSIAIRHTTPGNFKHCRLRLLHNIQRQFTTLAGREAFTRVPSQADIHRCVTPRLPRTVRPTRASHSSSSRYRNICPRADFQLERGCGRPFRNPRPTFLPHCGGSWMLWRTRSGSGTGRAQRISAFLPP